MKQSWWGNIVWIDNKTTDEELMDILPETVKTVLHSIVDGIKENGLTPMPETLQVIVRRPGDENASAFISVGAKIKCEGEWDNETGNVCEGSEGMPEGEVSE